MRIIKDSFQSDMIYLSYADMAKIKIGGVASTKYGAINVVLDRLITEGDIDEIQLCREIAIDMIDKNPNKAALIFWDGLMKESAVNEKAIDLLSRALPYINNRSLMCEAECLGTCKACKIKKEIREIRNET